MVRCRTRRRIRLQVRMGLVWTFGLIWSALFLVVLWLVVCWILIISRVRTGVSYCLICATRRLLVIRRIVKRRTLRMSTWAWHVLIMRRDRLVHGGPCRDLVFVMVYMRCIIMR